LPAQLGDRFDTRQGDQVPSRLILEDGENLHRHIARYRGQGAAGVGEKVYLTSERRADGDLAADAQKLDVDTFFLVVAFFVGNDQTDHRCRKRGMRDPNVIDRLSRTGCK
jgi:hypothetical protein